MSTCSQTNIPELNPQEEPCDGIYTPTTCIVQVAPFTTLGITANTPLSDVLTAIVAALNNQQTLINNLTTEVTNQQTQINSLSEQLTLCCSPQL